MLRNVLTIFTLSCVLTLNGQGEGNHWYFGSFAGIDFNSGQPVAVTDGALSTREGCSTISDEDGNLLMYTDGVKIWNRNHHVMPNGTGLKGNTTTTQSGLIVQKPGSDHLVFVFTVGEQANNDGLQYSIVDLHADGGLGDVISKNNPVHAPTAEKLTAVKHDNGEDIWIVSHDWGNDFLAFLLTKNGLNTTPVKSQIGAFHNCGSVNACAIGQMKANAQGTKLAVALFENVGAEVFDFDNQSGVVSNKITLPVGFSAYGIEFSPNGCLLYVAHGRGVGPASVHQFNLEAGNPQDVWDSDTIVGQFNNHSGQLQLAPDGKIYMAQFGEPFLSVIHNPNGIGAACNFETNGFSLGLRTSLLGLPNYFPAFNPDIVARNFCLWDTTFFQFARFKPGVQLTWNFGDPVTGAANMASGDSVWHIFSDTGTFFVQLICDKNGVQDTVTRKVIIQSAPVLTMASDTTVCLGDSALLWADANSPGTSYKWSHGATTPSSKVVEPGVYRVSVENVCGQQVDSVEIANYDLSYEIPPEVTGCDPHGALVEIDLITGLSVLWPDGSNDFTYPVATSQVVHFTVTNTAGCTVDDSVSVVIQNPIMPELGADTIICRDSSILLTINPINYLNWEWSDGSSDPGIEVSESTLVHVQAEDLNGCSVSDTVAITVIDCEETLIVLPTAFSPNGDGLNDRFGPITRNVQVLDFRIYNRWGELIFQSTHDYWDGTYQGKFMPIGSYGYLVRYLDNYGQPQIVSGNVTLLR